MRAYNFNAGPAALPYEVLQRAQAELPDYEGSGMSIMEMSHRSKAYELVHERAKEQLRSLLGVAEETHILFLQGGASMQFGMVPMNFLHPEQVACYVQSGNWSNKAFKEAKLVGDARLVAASDTRPLTAPDLRGLELPANTAYLHVTSNETIEGLRLGSLPDTGNTPIVCDMSSDILSRSIDASRYGLIYAGAQKNLGPSGVTVVIVKPEMLSKANQTLPSMLRYEVHAKGNSLYNTPPTFAIYLMSLVLDWVTQQGGLPAISARNTRKAGLIYQAIDDSDGFYTGLVAKPDRSDMNITFGLADELLEPAFLSASVQAGFVGLKGHRELGHFRASTYNAVPEEHCQALADFMRDFMRQHG